MGVMMQAFYWDCPREENREFAWWNYLRENIPGLARSGLTCLWLPPAHKAANVDGPSMGYDPYDYYDLGEYDQRGSVKTWFGSKKELFDLIKCAHDNGMQVIADMVLNLNSGAEDREVNPLTGDLCWTRFRPLSGKFNRNWDCFHPSLYESWPGEVFGAMPMLCHQNPYVYAEILKLARWLIEDVGFDGFRYDFVKGYGGRMINAIQQNRYLQNGVEVNPFGVGEAWDSERTIDDWLDEANAWSANPVGAFDFPLRWRLRDLCDSYGFSLRNLAEQGVLMWDRPERSVTFVENHDVERDMPIINDKMLAYAFILTHEGYPCVFWKDYYNYGLAKEGTPNGIAALVRSHGKYAGGSTQLLWVDDDIYIMARNGSAGESGLVFVLNNKRSEWNGAEVTIPWPNTRLHPVAWWSKTDLGRPEEKDSQDGRVKLWAAPRGYAIYVPKSQGGSE
jgi:alpha-amylase